MTLRQKALTTTTAVFMALAVIMLLISLFILQSGFLNVEKQDAHRGMELVLGNIDNDIEELSSNAQDYSGWDHTYAFVQNHDPAYIRVNIIQSTFTTKRLNLIMFFDIAGNRIYETGFDLQKIIFTPVPRMLQDRAFLKRLLESAQRTDGVLNGILLLDEGPMAISVQPILKSDFSGPARGALIMGRFLNEAETRRLTLLTHENIQLYRFSGDGLAPDLRQARPRLNVSKAIVVQPLNDETIRGYSRIDDVFGQPALILCTTGPMTLYQQGLLTIKALFAFLLLSALVFLVVSLFLFERLVMRRLSRMSEEALEIGKGDHRGRRFLITGQDELSILGKSMNIMMEKIEQTESLLRTEASRYRAVIEDQTELVCRYAKDGRLIFVNDAYCRYYGKTRQDLLDSMVFVSVNERDRPHVDRCRQALNRDNPTATYEYRVTLTDGRIRWQNARERMISDEIGQPLEFQLVIRDVTDRKLTEESLKDAYAGLEQRIQERTAELQRRNDQLSAEISRRTQSEEILRISEARYRGIVEDQTELICRMTPGGHLTFVNGAYSAYLGQEAGELIGKEFLSFVHEEDRKHILDMMTFLSPEHPVITFHCRRLMENGRFRWQQWTERAILSEGDNITEYQAVGRDITDRRQSEEALQQRQRELDEKSRCLEEANVALRVLLKQKEEDRDENEERILSNINELVMPYVEKLKIAPLDARNRSCLEILEANLRDIRSSFTGRLTSAGYNLTSKELDVANLIRDGKSTKEIAELLYLSKNTVDFHRNNIRRKLGITNEKTNLRAYLTSLS